MADARQNDWDVVADALQVETSEYDTQDAAVLTLARLREFTEVTIAGLNERIRMLEEEIRSENKWPGERKHGSWEYQDRA